MKSIQNWEETQFYNRMDEFLEQKEWKFNLKKKCFQNLKVPKYLMHFGSRQKRLKVPECGEFCRAKICFSGRNAERYDEIMWTLQLKEIFFSEEEGPWGGMELNIFRYVTEWILGRGKAMSCLWDKFPFHWIGSRAIFYKPHFLIMRFCSPSLELSGTGARVPRSPRSKTKILTENSFFLKRRKKWCLRYDLLVNIWKKGEKKAKKEKKEKKEKKQYHHEQ